MHAVAVFVIAVTAFGLHADIKRRLRMPAFLSVIQRVLYVKNYTRI